jgi:hypothetical protein
MSLFIEKSPLAFLLITVMLGGGVAYMTGRALARGWKPVWMLPAYMALLGLFVRFLHWGLFLDATFPSWRAAQGNLFSLHYYLTDTAILILAGLIGFQRERTRQMTTQYRWLYRRTSPFTWQAVGNDGADNDIARFGVGRREKR